MLPDRTPTTDEVLALFERLRCSGEDERLLADTLQSFAHYERLHQKTIELIDRLRVEHLGKGRLPWLYEAEDAFVALHGFSTEVAEEPEFFESRLTR